MALQFKFWTMLVDAKLAPLIAKFPASGARAGSIRLQTLVLMRWIAVGGQALTVLIVYFVLEYDLYLAPALATIGASFVLNVYLTLRYPVAKRLNETEAAVYLIYDTLQLVVLLYLTGGLHNPFSFLMLAPALISATVLSMRTTIMLIGLVLLSVSALVFIHLPLPWSDEPHQIGHIYVLGIWSSIVIGVLFFSANVMRVAGEGWRLSSALMETQIALAREQRLSAIGGLAAAAAHELGTPLGTISLVAKELSHEFKEDSPHAEDIRLLISQSERCREILERLTMRSKDGSSPSFHNLPLLNLVEMAAQTLNHRNIEVAVEPAPGLADGDGRGRKKGEPRKLPQPVVSHSLEIIHGLENFIENAVDFATARVSVNVGWSDREAVIEITDDGPGFERDILRALGEPYVSSRRDKGGMGLGVFISKTLLERTGAEIEFDNLSGGGARIAVTWLRPLSFEVPPASDGGPPADGGEGPL